MSLQIRIARGRRGRDEAERFRLAALEREDGVYDHDLVNDRVWWNDTYDRLFGPRSPASEASAEWWRERLHPEDRPRVLSSLQHALAGPEDRWSCAYRLVRPDGDVRSVLDRATIRRDGAGSATRVLGAILDLTDHDRALETERKARAAAERASRMKDDFVVALAHELRTPVHAVLAWARLIRNGAMRGNALDQAIETIERNARTQARLVDDLAEVCRGAAGLLELQLEDVDLAHVVETVLGDAAPAAAARSVLLERPARAPALPVRGDGAWLHRTVSELCGHAIQWTPQGGTVVVDLRRDGSQARLTVKSGGTDATATRGTAGLAVALARQMVELHGGELRAESAGPRGGARFEIALPLLPATAGELGESLPRN